jgi:hypothetical protein
VILRFAPERATRYSLLRAVVCWRRWLLFSRKVLRALRVACLLCRALRGGEDITRRHDRLILT